MNDERMISLAHCANQIIDLEIIDLGNQEKSS
jgi:hypothetical protein